MNTAVSKSSTNTLVDFIRNEDIQSANQTTNTTGVGAAGPLGPAPDVTQVALATSLIMSAVMASVGAMSLNALKSEDSDVALLEAQATLDKMMAEVQNGEVKTDTARQRAALGEKEKQLTEAQNKINEAEQQQKNLSIWDKIKLAFQWIGAILSIAIGALMIATGAGAVLGGLMIAAGIAGIVTAVDSTLKATDDKNHLGIAGQIAMKTNGGDLEAAQTADRNFGYAMMGVTAALALATLAVGVANIVNALAEAGGSISGAIVDAVTNAVPKAVSEAFSKAGMSANITLEASNAAKMALRGAELANDILSLGEAVGGGVVAGFQYEATKMQAEGKKLMSEAKKMDALLQQIQDLIDQVINRIKSRTESFAQVVDDAVSSVRDRSDALARVRFT